MLHNLRYDETLAQFGNASGVGTNADLFLTGSAAQAARLAAAGAVTAISFRTGEAGLGPGPATACRAPPYISACMHAKWLLSSCLYVAKSPPAARALCSSRLLACIIRGSRFSQAVDKLGMSQGKEINKGIKELRHPPRPSPSPLLLQARACR